MQALVADVLEPERRAGNSVVRPPALRCARWAAFDASHAGRSAGCIKNPPLIFRIRSLGTLVFSRLLVRTNKHLLFDTGLALYLAGQWRGDMVLIVLGLIGLLLGYDATHIVAAQAVFYAISVAATYFRGRARPVRSPNA
jgi:hypothetical protein